jgi:hypothetical protein
MTSYGGRAPRRAEDVKVDPVLQPGWITGLERLPDPGETVYCSRGEAEVVRLLGKTESGRLIELRIAEQRSPFFATAGNILVPPVRQLPEG